MESDKKLMDKNYYKNPILRDLARWNTFFRIQFLQCKLLDECIKKCMSWFKH